ncbi:MAG TPA: carboxypeptidase-like regulatory domain-containing protein, partial [Chitinophagaceae bacterium]|nr:carboxypeptidase-like regulatory domain-containing protein [Chitinophagaceae bacterium]
MKRHVLLQVLLFVMCAGSTLPGFAQERTLTGTVTDEKGATLPGATITVKGSSLATRTEANGKFSLNIPASAKTIVVSFIGMESQEYNLSRKNTIDISLRSVATTLGDVVVVGYGSVRRKDATGALSSLKREDLIRDAPTNILSAMQGKVAGVNVTQNDGAPGAALSIRVRGSNSFLGGTEPLYVIDGVPFNNTSSG